MSIYDLKPRFQNLLRPICKRLAGLGVTANHVTLLALAISLVQGFALWTFRDASLPWLLLPVVLFVRMALNAVDGMLAREHGMASRRGALLNEVGDVVSDTVLYLPFAALAGSSSALVLAIVLLAGLTEFLGVCAVMVNSPRRYEGPMGKSDRAFVFGALGLLVGLGVQASLWLFWVWVVMILMLLETVRRRFEKALEETS